MLKKIGIVVAGLTVVAWSLAPVFARTADEIRAEIRSLEAKLISLREELAGVEGQNPGWCYTFDANVRIGDRGPAVLALKEALRREGLYNQKDLREDFDESLAASVTAFQEKYREEILRPVGLSHGTGYVGKNTRAKLNQLYGCTKPPPPPGAVLEVKTPAQFVLIPGMTAHVANWQDMRISLKEIVVTKIVCVTAPCIPPVTAFISVTAPGGCGPQADPRCLGAPSYYQEFRLERGQTVDALGLPIHLVEANERQATIKMGKENSTTNQPPVIRTVQGPTELAVNQGGTWTITAYDPERASLRYSVLWGDTQNFQSPSGEDGSSGATNDQTVTFTHSYAREGTYTVTFMVSDNAGQNTKSTMTVKVGGSAKQGYLYLQPASIELNVGEIEGVAAYWQAPMPPCPVGYACAQVMPAPMRVDAAFSIENSEIAGLVFALPGCVAPPTGSSAYCGRFVSVEGKKLGTTTISAKYEGLTVSGTVVVK